MRIAYVEDNATNQALVERVARMTQHVIVPYSEGEVALDALQSEPFDMIMMDIELAGKVNGLDVVRALREAGIQTPIIAVTAYAMKGDRDRCLDAGCNDYLPKPIPIKDLLDLLNRYEAKFKTAAATPEVSVPASAPVAEAAPEPKPAPHTAPITPPIEAVSPPAPAQPAPAPDAAAAPAPTPVTAPHAVPVTPPVEVGSPPAPVTALSQAEAVVEQQPGPVPAAAAAPPEAEAAAPPDNATTAVTEGRAPAAAAT